MGDYRFADARAGRWTILGSRSPTRANLIEMIGILPDGSTPEEAVASLEGAFASAFIRGQEAARP